MYLNVLIVQCKLEEFKNHFNINGVQLYALNESK